MSAKLISTLILSLLSVVSLAEPETNNGVQREVEFVEDSTCISWLEPENGLPDGVEVCSEISGMTTSQYMKSGMIKRSIHMYTYEVYTYYGEVFQIIEQVSDSSGIGSEDKGVIASKIDREGCVTNDFTGDGLVSVYRLHFANGRYVVFDFEAIPVDCDTYFD
jgi:hypothetical protein